MFKQINEVAPIEISKIIGSLLWAFIFLLYFIFSKRVKKTFVKEAKVENHIMISAIIPIILFFYYTNNLSVVKNNIPLIKTEKMIEQKNNASQNKVENDYSKISFENLEYQKLFLEAKNNFDLKDYNNAILKFEKLIKINYNPAESNYYLAESWFMKEKYDMAIKHFKMSATLNDKASYLPTLLLHTTISFVKIKDRENAKNFCNTLIELYPNSREAEIAKNFREGNFEREITPKEFQPENKYIESNNNSIQQIFKYKDWKIESIDNLFKLVTNGKVGATGHEFGIIKRKKQCNDNLLWLTFSTLRDISPYIGQNVKFKISIDEHEIYLEQPILNVTKISSTLNIVSFSNFLFNDYAISMLKKGNKIKVDIIETNILYDKFDIKSEEFSLDGFVANYTKLVEQCDNTTKTETK